jgi:AraC-like DNA-binding protein
MAKRRGTAGGADSQFEFNDGGTIARRKTGFLPDGAYLFEDALAIKGVLTAKVITGAVWLLELYELTAGELFFISGAERVRPRTSRVGVFYPPFTIAQPCFKDACGRTVGVAADAPVPKEFLTSPSLFETDFTGRPSGAHEVVDILRAGAGRQAVELNPRPSLLSLKAKRLLDENHLCYPSIARVAARLGVTHAHLSRQFKHDFTLSPSAYLRQVRLADAPLRLAQGQEIVQVALAVGYNDLSRFYKQFRKTTKTSPGVCRTMMKPGRAS